MDRLLAALPREAEVKVHLKGRIRRDRERTRFARTKKGTMWSLRRSAGVQEWIQEASKTRSGQISAVSQTAQNL